METNKLRGLVLSGGESRRMGQDKGLITSDSTPWVNRSGMLLKDIGLPVSVMIRKAQRAAYAAVILPEFELAFDADLPVGGPLKGLLSFHRLYPQNDVLILPCDMPKLTSKLLTDLIQFYTSQPDFDACIFENQEILQPFPGIYSARFLNSVLGKVQRGELPRHGLRHLLDSVNTARSVIDDDSAFRNFNIPLEKN